MFTLPICLATLPPSRPPSASPTAPVAYPVLGVFSGTLDEVRQSAQATLAVRSEMAERDA